MRIENFPFIFNLIWELYRLPVRFLDSSNHIVYNSNVCKMNPLYESDTELLNELLLSEIDYRFPLIKTTSMLENYLIIKLIDDTTFLGTLLVGPAALPHISEKNINSFFKNKQKTSNWLII